MEGLTPLFDLEAVGLGLTPTEAMRKGEQVVQQCAWCGAVVVWIKGGFRTGLGLCPACGRDGGGKESGRSTWWGETLPVAGLHRADHERESHA